MERPSSIVLVTVDCLRADHVGFMGYVRPTTPFLDSLAQESLVFPNAVVSGAPTYYSFPAIMASRHPLSLGRDVIGLAPGESTLAATLHAEGYATAAFVAGNPYLAPEFGYDQGFDVYRDFLEGATAGQPDYKPPGRLHRMNRTVETFARKLKLLSTAYDELYFQYCQRAASDKGESLDQLRRFPAADVLVDEACKWLASAADRPFFLWLHFMDPHFPYYPSDEAIRLMGSEEVTASEARYWNSYWNRSDVAPSRLSAYRNQIIGLYDAGIRWVDEQLGRLGRYLRDRSRWENCALVFTADHGEEFLDHGGRFHPPSNLSEEIIHVPLLLTVPGVRKKEVCAAPFSHLNLAPTLLNAVGVSSPATFRGRNLWQQIRNGGDWEDAAVVESIATCSNPFHKGDRMGARSLALRKSVYKLVLGGEQLQDELFNIETDPGEHQPLTRAVEREVRRELLECARNHLQTSLQMQHSPYRLRSRIRDLRLELAKTRENTAVLPVASGA